MSGSCKVCPTTDSAFDLRTWKIKEWFSNNPVQRILTPTLGNLFVYPVKRDEKSIYISITRGFKLDVVVEKKQLHFVSDSFLYDSLG